MAVTTTARLGVTRWSAGTDPFTRAQMDASMAALEANAAMYSQGAGTGTRPAAGKQGRFYWDDTAKILYYDNGTTWAVAGAGAGGGGGDALMLMGA